MLSKQLTKFRLRSLLLVVALISLLLAIHLRRMRVKDLIAENHYSAMRSGYLAVELQRPKGDSKWLANFRLQNYSSEFQYEHWREGLKMDRESLAKSRPLWESAINHIQRRDYYRKLYAAPWRLFAKLPSECRLPELPDSNLPDSNAELKIWWSGNIEKFARENEFNVPFAAGYRSVEVNEFNCEMLNYASSRRGKTCVTRLFALREIVGASDE